MNNEFKRLTSMIKDRRKGLSDRQLAEYLGVSFKHYKKLINGNYIPKQSMFNFLNITIDNIDNIFPLKRAVIPIGTLGEHQRYFLRFIKDNGSFNPSIDANSKYNCVRAEKTLDNLVRRGFLVKYDGIYFLSPNWKN